MSNACRQLPPPADRLGEALHLLKLTGTLYCRGDLTAPWGVEVPALEGSMALQVVTQGRCWLEVEGAAPRLLEQGSLTLIPHGSPHRAWSRPGVAARPLFDIPVEQISERYEIMRYGGGGELTQLTYAVVSFDHFAAKRLVAQLPRVIHVDAWDESSASWLQSSVRFIAREALALRPGGETIITRLADILVIQAIRSWLESAPEANEGWLRALRDERVGRALASMHRAPDREWSVASLAREAAMSRSAFSARFTDLVGESAMHYLSEWRLQLARTHLQHSPEPIADAARRFGYQSEAAFSRAFKRAFGVSPGSVRPTTTAAPASSQSRRARRSRTGM